MKDAADSAPFAPYVEERYLRTVFATTKLLNGIGDAEQWYSLLNDPNAVNGLKNAVSIEFAPDNKNFFGATDAVSLSIDVKNVPQLLVKVFEINTGAYYAQFGAQVGTSINLDGLIANDEQVHVFDQPPIRRVRKTIELPALAKPGVTSSISSARASAAAR